DMFHSTISLIILQDKIISTPEFLIQYRPFGVPIFVSYGWIQYVTTSILSHIIKIQ
ncbi:22982_t:CDS:2, partial [Cetraspora pellucida]